MPNIALLNQVLGAIKANPNQWNQREWLVSEEDRVEFEGQKPGCGSSYCFAGWAVHLAGYKVDEQSLTAIDHDGEEHGISVSAQHALDLSEWWASELFGARNSLNTLEGLVDEITKGWSTRSRRRPPVDRGRAES